MAAVEELKPKLLWIHAARLNGHLPRLLSAVEVQLAGGHGVVLQAPREDEAWSLTEDDARIGYGS